MLGTLRDFAVGKTLLLILPDLPSMAQLPINRLAAKVTYTSPTPQDSYAGIAEP